MFKKSDLRFFGVVIFISTCLMISISARIVVDDPSKINVQCMRGVIPVIGDVPDPFNCYKYYSCVTTDLNPPTRPVPRNCPLGPGGAPLFYDFRNCNCAYNSSVCYDGSANIVDFFICAQEYKYGTNRQNQGLDQIQV